MINIQASSVEFQADPSVLFIVNSCKMTNYGRCNTADQTQADAAETTVSQPKSLGSFLDQFLNAQRQTVEVRDLYILSILKS